MRNSTMPEHPDDEDFVSSAFSMPFSSKWKGELWNF